ncbi:hypothetical protein RFI_28893 [Reticulomyxa filosa]|uniref:Uncharacterized protein n=1 Tax=Reticulomyxa filosa TaxID=46433 RepID=X6M3J3_RETFI|nr:hypothetical protein RFI_28893 [Reticulomyxa filosa]|eukprot:ETO08494.1 hypothetical protein RFI_28893 [Reticulomyxa filosa]
MYMYIFYMRKKRFDIGWCQALEDTKWRLHIDYSDHQNNWFLRRRLDVGNPKYGLMYYGVWFVLVLLGIAISIIENRGQYSSTSRVLLAVPLLVSTIHCTVILIKLPAYNDTWHVREEIKYVCLCQLLCAILWLFFALLSDPQPPSVTYALLMLSGGYLFIFGGGGGGGEKGEKKGPPLLTFNLNFFIKK